MKQGNFVVLDTLTPLPESVTLCATVDESGDEHVITDLMISQACDQIENDQIWPMVGSNVALGIRQATNFQSAKILPFRRRA